MIQQGFEFMEGASIDGRRPVGRLVFEKQDIAPPWVMTAQPHVEMFAKRMFPGIRASASKLRFSDTPQNCFDLRWFMQRFPLTITADDLDRLTGAADSHVRQMVRLDAIETPDYEPPEFEMEIQPRKYQRAAAEKYLIHGSLLVGDDVGLGKTCTAICTFTDKRTLPAVVVCMPHLQRQWLAEIRRFMPRLRCHIIKKATHYTIANNPDVLIISYHKLHAWGSYLADYCRSAVFDEVQELRRAGSNKYEGAERMSQGLDYRLGLSATPIFNYGDEMHNVMSILRPGCLGSQTEFLTAWCTSMGQDKNRIKDPRAFGAFLRDQHLMVRRTRADVGRELPEQSRMLQVVSNDTKPLEEAETAASELANLILEGSREQAFSAAGQFDTLMRQVTGISKAPHVASFVRLIVESGEPVVLFGWHRAVYRIWEEALAPFNPVLYTGSESTAAKAEALERFKNGYSKVLIMSLRSGAGVDGLQHCCKTVVFGEFDWAPAVHEQCIGRVARDGQMHPVFVYYLMAAAGADPHMVEVLGVKKEQLTGIRSPETGRDDADFANPQAGREKIAAMARKFLKKK